MPPTDTLNASTRDISIADLLRGRLPESSVNGKVPNSRLGPPPTVRFWLAVVDVFTILMALTLDTYGHLFPGDADAAVSTIEKIGLRTAQRIDGQTSPKLS